MKRIGLLFLLVCVLLLSACSSSAATEAVVPEAVPTQVITETEQPAPPAVPEEDGATVSAAYQLLLGVLELEGTDQAITAEQAAVWLPLWENYQTLAQQNQPDPSEMPTLDTNATQALVEPVETNQDEIDAVVTEIQAVLTDEQTQAITDLQITRDSAQTMLSELGIKISNAQPDGQNPGGGSGTTPDGTPGAGGPGGGPGGQAGGTPPADAGAPSTENGQPPAGNGVGDASQGGQRGSMIPSALLDAVLNLLTDKTG